MTTEQGGARGGAGAGDRPAIVLADEPAANLDSARGEAIISLVLGINRRANGSVSSTHDSGVVARARRVARLADARVAVDAAA